MAFKARRHAQPVSIAEESLFGAVVSREAAARAVAMVAAYYGADAGDVAGALAPYMDQCDAGFITPFEALAAFFRDAVELAA